MIQNLKKIILIFLLIIACLATISHAATKTYSDVQYDVYGRPYIVYTVTHSATNKVEHILYWDASENKFYVNEQVPSNGYGPPQSVPISVSYDKYKEAKEKEGKTVPTKEELTNASQTGNEKSQEDQKKRQEEQEQKQQQGEQPQQEVDSESKAIENAKNPDGKDVAKFTVPGDPREYYMMKVDGEWVIVMKYAPGYYLVLHWSKTEGAFVGSNPDSQLPTAGHVSYNQAEASCADFFRERGIAFPTRAELDNEATGGVIDPDVEEEDHTMDKDVVLLIRKSVALWYYIFRYLSIALMLVILLILGIKIAINSVAEKKAMYKKMLVDWFVGFIIIVTIHYLMIGIIFLNQEGINLIVDTANRVYSQDQRVYVAEDASQYGSKEYQSKTNQDLEVSLYESVRTRAFDAKLTNGCIGMVFYACLVYLAYKFTFVYLKRMINIIILTVMSPLVAVSFSLNKILTGKASIFSKWFKEYFTIVFIQFFHALAYVTFVMGTLKIALSSLSGVLFALLLLKFLSDSEEIIKKIFGMDSNVLQDLSGTMRKGPSEYVKVLKKGSEVVVGVGAAGQLNKALRKLMFAYPMKKAGEAFGETMKRRAERDIKNRKDVSDPNLQNSPAERDFVEEIIDYDDDATELTPEQQEMKDIVESERYLDAKENGVELEGEEPKYKTRYALNLAKQKLANNPKIILAATKQRISDAFDFRTYTERYAEMKPDGSIEVSVRYKKDSKNIFRKREETYQNLIRQQFSLKNIVGYSDEDMEQFRGGVNDVVSTAGGFFGTILAMGAVAESGTLAGLGMYRGISAFQKGINTLAQDNVVEVLPEDFEENQLLSVEEIDALKDQVTDELITRKDSYIVNSIARKHRSLAKKLANPFELGLAVTSYPAGKLYRDVSNFRWQCLRFDMMEQKKELQNRRTVILQKIKNTEIKEIEDVDATVALRGRITKVQNVIMDEDVRTRKLKELRKELNRVDKRVAKLDKQLRKLRTEDAKLDQAITVEVEGRKEFEEKIGHISRSGGIGYSKREFVVDSTIRAIKAVDKEMRREKLAYWKKVEKLAKKERLERTSRPINMFVAKGLEKGVLNKVEGVSHVEAKPASDFGVPNVTNENEEPKTEEFIVPVYDLEDCVRVARENDAELIHQNEENREQAVDEAYEEWEKNYQESLERRKKAEEEGKIIEENKVEVPKKTTLPAAPMNFKVSLDDVKVAIINTAARKNTSVRKYKLTTGNTNEIKKELFSMVKKMYLYEADMPAEVVNYINSLDSIIAYAKSTLVANELAAEAINQQIEENGVDGVDVDEAVEKVKAGLTEYFEETYNEPLPERLQKHDFIEEETIIEDAGYDTIQGLAEKTMKKKLDSMAEIIRVKNTDEDGSVSPEAEQVISKIREEMRKSFRGEDADLQSKKQDKMLRMFYKGAPEDQEDEENKEDESELGFSVDDVVSEEKEAELERLFSTIDPETGQFILEESVAEEEKEAQVKAMAMDDIDHRESTAIPSQEEQDKFFEESLNESDSSDEEDTVIPVSEQEEKGATYTPPEDTTTTVEEEPVQEVNDTTTTTEQPITTESEQTDTTIEEPITTESEQVDTTVEDSKTTSDSETTSVVDELINGIETPKEAQEPVEEPVYQEVEETGGEAPNKYGFRDTTKVDQTTSAQQPTTGSTNPPEAQSTTTPAFNNEEPVQHRTTTNPNADPNGEKAFFQQRKDGTSYPGSTTSESSSSDVPRGQNTTQKSTPTGNSDSTTSDGTAVSATEATTNNAKNKTNGVNSSTGTGNTPKDGSKKVDPEKDGSKQFVLVEEDVGKKGKDDKGNKVNASDIPKPTDGNDEQQ